MTATSPVRAADRAAVLADGYRTCARLTREHGTTYYWGAALLPAERRRHVHAVYALCRIADDIVDAPGATTPASVAATRASLAAFGGRFAEAVAAERAGAGGEPGSGIDPVLAAVARSVVGCDIDPECFERFFGAMSQDLTTTSYERWDDLLGYMEGSAAVIGEMMLPVLTPTSDAAFGPARSLGLAFQLTNFLRDVGEDLDRGRVYVPQEDLRRFGADPAARTATPEWRALMAFEIARNRELYDHADTGIAHLPGASARCVQAARVLYAQILDRIEAADHDVFATRVRVPTWRKAATAARVVAAPRPAGSPTTSRAGGSLVPHPDIPVRNRPQPPPARMTPTWRDAKPSRIRASLDLALKRDPGSWYVVGSSRDLGRRSVTRVVGGQEVVLWRTSEGVVAGPGACPHLGALLTGCDVIGDSLYCRWHGLAIEPGGSAGWTPYAAHDDGVLLWVRIPTQGEGVLDAPVITPRPALATSLSAVVEVAGTCEPRDIVANRLDPWHGSWFHPYSFSHLTVDEDASDPECLVVDVTFRLGHRFGVPVRAEFACPDARTIVMTITEGEGAGSVVETHATPLGPDADGRARTMMTEATIATSERAGFGVARAMAPLLRPAMRRTQRRLWVDDMTYAQRSYELRARGDDFGL